MYGMVNKAVEELVTNRFGEETWLVIKEKADVDVEAFISNEGYDDRITYDLVEAATEVLGVGAEEILEAFGEHWVLETAQRGYGAMMDAGGKTLPEFLRNLPDLHSRVLLVLPNLQPPEFGVSEEAEGSIVLHYKSHRPGLQPFVVGLIKGLGKRFNTELKVTLRAGRHTGLDHDEFLIAWS